MMTDKPKTCHSLKEVGEVKADGAKTLKELGYTDIEIAQIQGKELTEFFEHTKSRGYTIVR